MKKFLFVAVLLNGMYLSSSAFAEHDDRYYHHRPHYDNYYNHGIYSSGYYYDPHAAYHGSHEEGAGEHVPTGSYASPYHHGVHHGYHYSEEEGYHSGTHYGHE